MPPLADPIWWQAALELAGWLMLAFLAAALALFIDTLLERHYQGRPRPHRPARWE